VSRESYELLAVLLEPEGERQQRREAAPDQVRGLGIQLGEQAAA